jgi:hypothetical protein
VFSRKCPFRAIFVGYSTRFSTLGSTLFATAWMCADSLYKTFCEVFIDFWTVVYTFRAFFGLFMCLWNRELLAQTEAKMMHFVTLTVPPPHADHNLMHNKTRGMSPCRNGMQVHFRENVCFEPFSWVIAHDFQHQGQFFCNTPDVHKLLLEDIWRGFH